ncbi:MAG: heme-binding protein [Hyphomicrobiaceae bacterium]|nr:heme-binding protein [Hyphomicrobiaceae bacterium]
MTDLTLAAANAIVAGTIEKAASAGIKPLAIAVLDGAGQLLAFQRQDGTGGLHRADIAIGKAYGALAVGTSSRWLHVQQETRPHFLTGLIAVAGGKMVPVPGGVLIKQAETGAVLGAVGVSGDTSDNDEIAAAHGIVSAGFRADL